MILIDIKFNFMKKVHFLSLENIKITIKIISITLK